MVSLNKIIQAKITIGLIVNKTPFALSAKLSKILGANGGDAQKLLDARKFHAPTKSASPFADL